MWGARPIVWGPRCAAVRSSSTGTWTPGPVRRWRGGRHPGARECRPDARRGLPGGEARHARWDHHRGRRRRASGWGVHAQGADRRPGQRGRVCWCADDSRFPICLWHAGGAGWGGNEAGYHRRPGWAGGRPPAHVLLCLLLSPHLPAVLSAPPAGVGAAGRSGANRRGLSQLHW